MKICDGKKKALTFADLGQGAVFRDADVHGVLFMKLHNGAVAMLTGDGAGYVYPNTARWSVTAVYPNACINPGEPE